MYSVDGLIDVERMAVDKIYYDLYYNPETKVFSRSDAEELSPEAQALINKATQLKVSRAVHADNAGEVEYSQITGENNCWDEESFTGSTGESTGGSTGKFIGPFGEEIGCSTNENNEPKYTFDPFVGSGTEVNPEIQTLQKPACLTGGAKIADENMGYVYMVDMADRSLNAKTAEVNSFRAGVFESPVPRVFEAPSAPTAIKAEELVVHDNGQLVWKDGQPVGVWVKNCEEAGREDQRCFKVVKDDHLPERTNFAHWVNSSNYVSGILEGEDPTKIKVLKTERTLNKNEAGIIVSRNYSFLIDKYT
ncbi:MAG: hypothetical protein IBX72_15300, partial [Nitrospirae bacterium]|nr:hypothetical protein [Nitrospirota bacterium]